MNLLDLFNRKNNRVAKFEKVSFTQFSKDCIDTFKMDFENATVESKNLFESYVKTWYDNIKIPTRATMGSAGYDFIAYRDLTIPFGQTVKIPTGIRAIMDSGYVLQCYPRSSHGFKYGIELSNSVGIIDEDYAYGDNGGHIFIKLVNKDDTIGKDVDICNGEAFCQGIFVKYGITIDDNANGKRNGGLGSTNK